MSSREPLRFGARLYALLLYLYPLSFRREYGESMLQLFNDQSRAAHGAGGYAMLWLKLLRDLVVSVPAAHSDERQSRTQRGSLTVGALFVWAVILAFVVAFIVFGVAIPSILGDAGQEPINDGAALVAASGQPTAAALSGYRALALGIVTIVTVVLAAAAFLFSRRQRSVLNGAASFAAGAILTAVPLAMMPWIWIPPDGYSAATLSILGVWPLAAIVWAVSTVMGRHQQRLGGA